MAHADDADQPTDLRTYDQQSTAASPAAEDTAAKNTAGRVDVAPSATVAYASARQWLLSQQHVDGFWCGELEGDSILQSESILLMAWLGKEQGSKSLKAARHLVNTQLPTGGWGLYPGSELEISASVKAYFALKLTGHSPDAEYMVRAREAIRAAGGADAVNSFTRFYLALLGQLDYEHCPAVPPEAMLLPNWAPINIYRISAWSRTILIPLAIMWAHRPVNKVDESVGIAELFLKDPSEWPPLRAPGVKSGRGWFTWEKFFRRVDSGLKWMERSGIRPFRARSLKKATAWMTERFVGSDGLGAIFPPIIWSVVALRCLGYDERSAEVRYCLEELESLMLEDREADSIRIQPCKSPVWDTAISLRALAAGGQSPDTPQVRRAVRWLLEKEVTRKGDWAANTRCEPGGWFFEHHNEFYPDLDDSIMVMMALREVFATQSYQEPVVGGHGAIVATTISANVDSAKKHLAWFTSAEAACRRAQQWILAMQNKDGGWGAFDRDNDAEFLCAVPFADHNAMIDPSTPDLTSRILEGLAQSGIVKGHPAVERAIAYLRETQEEDGSWYGRWGVNYIYGTWQVLVGLIAAGVPQSDPAVRGGVEWLLAHQQAGGGWGESPASYEDREQAGRGPVTASQTAWALLGLMAAGESKTEAVRRGVAWLTEHQTESGTWNEPEFTGTGFPQVFYLRYHLYPHYFPMLALATYSNEK